MPIDIGAGDQFKPEFLTISPNNKIPAIVDPRRARRQADLAVRVGRDPGLPRRQDRPASCPRRDRAQVRGAAVADVPDGQRRPDARPGAPLPHLCAGEDRVRDRTATRTRRKRLYGVIDKRLANSEYSAAANTRIADIATLPWLRCWKNQGIALGRLPAPEGLVRRDRRAARRAARRRGAGRRAQAAGRRPGARSAVRRDAVRAALKRFAAPAHRPAGTRAGGVPRRRSLQYSGMTRERESYDWQSTHGQEHRSTDFGPTTGFGPTSGHRPMRRPVRRKSALRWLIFTAALVLATAVAAALLVPG